MTKASFFSVSPLNGKQIVITRPPHKAEAFAAQLRELGAVPVLMPLIEIRPPREPILLDAVLQGLAAFDWMIITSANAVTHIWRRFEVLQINPAQIIWPKIAAIGPATANMLHQHGVEFALMPDEHVAEALFAALDAQIKLKGTRILLPQGNLARSFLADSLAAAGADVLPVIAYETVRSTINSALLKQPFDAITFTSSSTVENFVDQFDDPRAIIGEALVACIGPVTADTARDLGLPVHVIADPYTVDGLIAALGAAFERNSTA
ncbi:MAG: uroporphyrinogen-III synthase [Anaerolineae bacterium]|nr:uroporphyrinogen-III synthase [Anaerolineae bacterium]